MSRKNAHNPYSYELYNSGKQFCLICIVSLPECISLEKKNTNITYSRGP